MSAIERHLGQGLTRRTLLVSGGLALGGLVVSCSAGVGDPVKPEVFASTLRYAEGGSFASFNPWLGATNQNTSANQVFSRLVYRSSSGEVIADLAESWKIAADGRSIQLVLRPGLKWHDGRAVVADDFVKMFGYLTDAALKPDPGVQKMIGLFAPVTAVKAPDARTVVMEFSTAVPYILDLLSFWYAVRFDDTSDPTFIKNRPATGPYPIGTGPYMMTKFVQGQSATFDAFPDYHVKGEPKTKTFVFNILASGSNIISDLRANQVDGVVFTNYADANALKGDAAYYTKPARIGLWLLMVNCAKPPFDNVSVRQALSHSLNRTQMAAAATFGVEEPVISPFFTAAATGHIPDQPRDSFDLAKAKSLLDAAGVKNLKITFPYPSSQPAAQAYGEIWQADLAKIGVQLVIQNVDQARWLNHGAGRDPETDVVIWFTNRVLLDGAVFWTTQLNYRGGAGSLSRLGYKNPTLESLVAQGSAEIDPAKRKQIYQELNRIVVNDAYNISLVTFSKNWAWSSKVAGTAGDLTGDLQLAKAVVKAP